MVGCAVKLPLPEVARTKIAREAVLARPKELRNFSSRIEETRIVTIGGNIRNKGNGGNGMAWHFVRRNLIKHLSEVVKHF